ncbi:neurogenic locus Notch protein, partial [Nephila pilipes]
TCSSDVDCYNGGGCFEEEGGKFCECLPETSGDRCETISECVEGNLRNCRGDNGTCAYDRAKKTAVCLCERGKAFDPSADICKGRCEIVNDCVDGIYKHCRSSGGTCTYSIGQKNAVCLCGQGKALNLTEYRCRECNCGAHGDCEIRQGRKICKCEDKYEDKDGFCTEKCRDNRDCYNGGWCLDHNGSKFCNCFWGLSGDKCEIIDDCVTGKYKDCREDRGTCIYDGIDKTAVCVCPKGKVLHPNKNVCKDECNDCQNGGTCHQDEVGNFCTCLHGTSGRRCEIVNECVDGIYRHCTSVGGICMFDVIQKNATCICSEGKAFDLIQNKCKECNCGEHGKCEFRYGLKVCICEEKYGEKNGLCTEMCNYDGDCVNGGKCIDFQKGKFCNCLQGLSGDKCEIVDDCYSGKYKNCRNGNGECKYNFDKMTAVCTCPGRKVYDLKENMCKDPNPCEPSPCVNGHCVAQMHDFECICDNPYTGRYCEISTCIQTKCFGGKCKLYGNREECHCPQGHRLENGTCLKNYCVETKCFNGNCLIENGVETCVCEEGYVYEGNECRKAKCSLRHCIGGECRILRGNLEECVCPSGFILIDGICTITSCTPRTCYGGRCERREGHLVCICPVGFHLEGVGCTETQCKEQNCFGGHCRVIKGEEICTCLDNYVLKDNQCQKTRCVEKSCFGGKCDVVDGEEVCSCPVGFEPHGDVCREI